MAPTLAGVTMGGHLRHFLEVKEGSCSNAESYARRLRNRSIPAVDTNRN